MGLRERKKIATRRAIAAVALELAHRDGPEHVTVDDIAAAADVSPRTIFNYFGTKDEAILGASPESRSETIEMVRARPVGEPPLESLKAVLLERLTTMDETGLYWRSRAELVRRFPALQPAYVASQVALETELISVVAERMDLDPAVDMYPALVVAVAFAALRVALARPGMAAVDGARVLDEDTLSEDTPGGRGIADLAPRVVLGHNLSAAFGLIEWGLGTAEPRRRKGMSMPSRAEDQSVGATDQGVVER